MSMTTMDVEIVAFKKAYANVAPALRKSLPSHITPERFERAAITAVQFNTDLLKADRRSLFLAIQRAASTGLLPDGREGAIVTFGNQAQWMPMVAGLMKLARNSGEIVSINAHIAYEGEEFSVVLGDDERIEHKRSMELADSAKPIGVYAVATLKSGEKVREVMTRAQVEKVRAVSRSKNNGPWVSWWDEMAKKTCIKRLSKRLPLSTDRDTDARLQRAIDAQDEDAIEATAVHHDETVAPPASKLEALAGTLSLEHDDDGVVTEHSESMQSLLEALSHITDETSLTAMQRVMGNRNAYKGLSAEEKVTFDGYVDAARARWTTPAEEEAA